MLKAIPVIFLLSYAVNAKASYNLQFSYDFYQKKITHERQIGLNNHISQNSYFPFLVSIRAQSFLGTPYVKGGNNIYMGVDCSSFVQIIYKSFGIELPRTVLQQANVVAPLAKQNLKHGDLVFFETEKRRPYSHVGIYIGHGMFIHAPRQGKRIKTDSIHSPYWSHRFTSAGRVFSS